MVAINTLVTVTLTAGHSWYTNTSSATSLTVIQPTLSYVSPIQVARLPSRPERRQDKQDICESTCLGKVSADHDLVKYNYCLTDCWFDLVNNPPKAAFSSSSRPSQRPTSTTTTMSVPKTTTSEPTRTGLEPTATAWEPVETGLEPAETEEEPAETEEEPAETEWQSVQTGWESIPISSAPAVAERSIRGYEECAAACEKGNRLCYQMCRELHIPPLPLVPDKITPAPAVAERSMRGYEKCSATCEKDNRLCYQMCRELHIPPLPLVPDKFAPAPIQTPKGLSESSSLVTRELMSELCEAISDTARGFSACLRALRYPSTKAEKIGHRNCFEKCRFRKLKANQPFGHNECLKYCGIDWEEPSTPLMPESELRKCFDGCHKVGKCILECTMAEGERAKHESEMKNGGPQNGTYAGPHNGPGESPRKHPNDEPKEEPSKAPSEDPSEKPAEESTEESHEEPSDDESNNQATESSDWSKWSNSML